MRLSFSVRVAWAEVQENLHINMADSLCCTEEVNNIVKQLYSLLSAPLPPPPHPKKRDSLSPESLEQACPVICFGQSGAGVVSSEPQETSRAFVIPLLLCHCRGGVPRLDMWAEPGHPRWRRLEQLIAAKLESHEWSS